MLKKSSIFLSMIFVAACSTSPDEITQQELPSQEAESQTTHQEPEVRLNESVKKDSVAREERANQLILSKQRMASKEMVSADIVMGRAAPLARSAPVAHNIIAYPPPPLPELISKDKYVERDDNEIKSTSSEPLSTISIDVDDGSFLNYKETLDRFAQTGGNINSIKRVEEAIRVEEFVNAFGYQYPEVSKRQVFDSMAEIVDSPWSDNKILKLSINSYKASMDELPPVNLVFLVDVSGSMREEIGLMREALKRFVNRMRSDDTVSIITYAGYTQVLVEATSINEKKKIIDAINSISASGSTNGESAIMLAYQQAEDNYIKGGINKIIQMSDGDFNVGVFEADSLESYIEDKRRAGISYSTVGVSLQNRAYNDNMMERIANVGNGHYTKLTSMEDLESRFLGNFEANLVNIASDVKIQIEFNPDVVKEYRLIGYQNRVLRNEDFNNDKVDAGELPSGKSVTVLYEINMDEDNLAVDPLRYKRQAEKTKENKVFPNEVAFLKIRYKNPGEEKSILRETPILMDESFSKKGSSDTNLALAAAGFGQFVRGTRHLDSDFNYDSIVSLLKTSIEDSKGDDLERYEFLKLVNTRKAFDEN